VAKRCLWIGTIDKLKISTLSLKEGTTMPFGPYDSFTDCVAKNADKASPEAFCAWLEHKITGKWPSESSMPEDAWKIYREAYVQYLDTSGKPVQLAEKEAAEQALKAVRDAGWEFSRIGWIRQYAAPKMRNVIGVRIFETGTWTDSSGNVREWTGEDLDILVAAFGAGVPGVVPLKAGHTPDSFNTKLAEKLDIPVELVIGDQGKGQISIGRMVTLERRGNILFASFERVPDVVAELIELGLYRTVSVEIEDKIGGFNAAITAVALLGAEQPAVAGATLDRALVFGGKREKSHVLSFTRPETLEAEFTTLNEKMADVIRGMRGAPVFRALMQNLRGLFDQITKKRQHGSPPIESKEGNKMPKSLKEFKESLQAPPAGTPPSPGQEMAAALLAIAQALGLSEGATVDDVLAAIEKLKAGTAPMEQYQKTQTELTKATERIQKLEHSERVHTYLERTYLFTAIPNKTAKDMAVELAELEEIAGKPKADSLLKTFQDLQKVGEAATKILGTSRSAMPKDYETKVEQFMKDNPKASRGDAHKAVMKAHPELREEYRLENRSSEEV
jgi:hypothetical protein